MAQLRAFVCDRIVFDDGIHKGAIVVDVTTGKIARIVEGGDLLGDERTEVVEITAGVLMPGIVDSHVHVNSPGRSTWEDYPCATRAAAAGGVTTIVDMPLNSIPPTTTLDHLKTKVMEANKCVYVDVAFWGGVIPGNEMHLLSMIEAGVVGFKCFLCHSGVDEFPGVKEADVEKALEVLEHTDSLLAFHAECELEDADNKANKDEADPEIYNTYLTTRPPDMEVKALNLIRKLSKIYKNARYHIVHVSAAHIADIVDEMRAEGVSITAETCPHYLTLAAENVPNSATEYKCAPPIRANANREKLWNAIKAGKLNMIVSDHSPCTPILKEGGFLNAWGGISSLQFGLSLIWTNAKTLGLSLCDVSKLMSAAPAQLCHIDDQKGSFAVGLDADFIVFDPDKSYTVRKDKIYHKNKLTPYLNMNLSGTVLQTYVRGQLIYDNEVVSDPPLGKLLLKNKKLVDLS